MKKNYLLLIAMLVFATTVMAQKKIKIAVEAGTFFPVNTLSENLETGYWINLNTAFQVQEKLHLNVILLYASFNGKTVVTTIGGNSYEKVNGDLNVVKIGGGLTYSLSPKFTVGGEIGFTIPKTGDSRYKESRISSTGGDFRIHLSPSNNYDDGGAKVSAGVQWGYSVTPRIKFSISYNYLSEVYGVTAMNDEVRSLSCVGMGIQYLIKK
jgi:hypothetical protein